MPNLYILAGPNGRFGAPTGKTTAAYTLLPQILEVFEFVNADEIARGLSPFNVESVAFEAGRLMLQRIEAGGHNIPEEVVHRRYERALLNLFTLYTPICDYYLLIDNSGSGPVDIARGGLKTEIVVSNVILWENLNSRYGNNQ